MLSWRKRCAQPRAAIQCRNAITLHCSHYITELHYGITGLHYSITESYYIVWLCAAHWCRDASGLHRDAVITAHDYAACAAIAASRCKARAGMERGVAFCNASCVSVLRNGTVSQCGDGAGIMLSCFTLLLCFVLQRQHRIRIVYDAVFVKQYSIVYSKSVKQHRKRCCILFSFFFCCLCYFCEFLPAVSW